MAMLTGGAPVRVEFLLNGEACVAGPLLVEHGNRMDSWNAVHYDALRVVVFGHTHLAKSIELGPRAHYFNSGTWCPTMSLDAAWYDPATPRADATKALRAFLADLDANRVERWLKRDAHCVRVEFEVDGSGALAGDVTADLCVCADDGQLTVRATRRLGR